MSSIRITHNKSVRVHPSISGGSLSVKPIRLGHSSAKSETVKLIDPNACLEKEYKTSGKGLDSLQDKLSKLNLIGDLPQGVGELPGKRKRNISFIL
jgi:hypothetical protein